MSGVAKATGPFRVDGDAKPTKQSQVIGSDFALLDVKKGRAALFRKLGYSREPTSDPIPVTITGYIVGAWGNDDGVSREFQVNVTEVEIS